VLIITGVLPIGLEATPVDGLEQPTELQTDLPLVVQVLAVLVLYDFLDYWAHRLMHRVRRLWLIHAVHHSAIEVDWLTASRKHPFQDTLETFVVWIPILLMGFSTTAIAWLYLIDVVYSAFLHSNVSWTLGPLRHVIASPVFHRWHHSSEVPALDKNFGLFFPWWDRMFGTMYFPDGVLPSNYGTYHDAVPPRFAEQLVYPLLKNPPMKVPALEAMPA
jgi:sterol desaturase/sphingolipid hydroxylase (fatty acid hydroxylase superfamily)